MAEPLERLTAALADRYRIERELGAGGMATVYLAHDLKHDREVAIKVLRPELAVVLGADRFLNEIKVTANLQHPHILPLYDSGEAGGLLYYVMPYVEGLSLRDKLKREGRLEFDEALSIVRDVAAALTYAHTHGVVHRDIKPENILIEDGEGLVADFGIALALSSAGGDRLTGTGFSVGTPAYMSPEQISGERLIDGRSDVYALACVFFELLTGEAPFAGPTGQAVMASSLVDDAPSVQARRTDLPQNLDAAIMRALAKDPRDRFETPREFVEACTPIPVGGSAQRRWPLWVAGVTIAVLASITLPLIRNARISRARALLPRIAALANEGQYGQAYNLAVIAERRLSGDSVLIRLMGLVSDDLTVTSEPEDAEVYLQPMSDEAEGPLEDSVRIGSTPIREHRIPRVDHRVVVRKDGYTAAERIASSAFGRGDLQPNARSIDLSITFAAIDSATLGMVSVPGGEYALVSPDMPPGLHANLREFFIDRFEVTNREYQRFMQAGGYTDLRNWQASTHGEGEDGPSSQLVDRTGLPGPRHWINQEVPEGKADHPVTDISWREAAAFCSSVGKRLPNLYEWEKTARNGIRSRRNVVTPWGVATRGSHIGRANFSSDGTAPVDAFPFGVSPYGAHAMAGNVKEWTATEVGEGFAVAGGSWQDPAYLFSQIGLFPDTFASTALGFRCARTSGDPAEIQGGGGPLVLDRVTPQYAPVSETRFRTLLSHYRYDPRPANRRGVEVTETADWSRERFWIDGVEEDSVLAYLYLPRRAASPFQTLLFVPSVGAFFAATVPQQAEDFMGATIKSGRAVLAPVLKGMLERGRPSEFVSPASNSVGFRDLMVLHATELRLGIDYLETRDDIDMQKLGYSGVSLGAGSRLPFAGVDDRYGAVILIAGGIDERVHPTLPEASNINFAPYIRPPKLMINGRQDEEHPWLTRALPLWTLLREPKELVLVDGAGHIVPAETRAPAINGFLDRVFGPVKVQTLDTTPPN